MPTVVYSGDSGNGVSSVQELNYALTWFDKAGGQDDGVAKDFVINLAPGARINLTQELYAINLGPVDTLTINGNGATIDGLNSTRGFFVYYGNVTINDLTIANT